MVNEARGWQCRGEARARARGKRIYTQTLGRDVLYNQRAGANPLSDAVNIDVLLHQRSRRSKVSEARTLLRALGFVDFSRPNTQVDAVA